MTYKFKVALIAGAKSTSEVIQNQLDQLLGEFLDISSFSIEEWMNSKVDINLALVSTHTLARQVAQNIKSGTKIIVIRRTLLKKHWEKVLTIPPREKLMLVNDERDSAVETIALLYELGARHIDLAPYYPAIEDVPHIKKSITPGELQLVPKHVKEIIDIGHRVIDVNTIADILTFFGVLNEETQSILMAYTEQIIPRSQGLQFTMEGLSHMNTLLHKTLDTVHVGVIAYEINGIITIFNRAAENIFSRNSWEIVGQKIDKFLKHENIGLLSTEDEIKDILIKVGQQNIIFNKLDLSSGGQITGGVMTLQVATKVEELGQKLRSELRSRGHQSKYSFRDLIFKSDKMKHCVSRALKMSGSNSNILILGETGTGKELFAHAIHNSSPRSKFSFVAINCSALPDNLLESELFGYEDGAFTGAKKGGKPGLFEQAHHGTIFLDEIGDVSQNLQRRFLRVLQQKEVLKVGGTKVVTVDVRVIAATNRNLAKLVREGEFRDDLYYRLKVLQLEVPPLRERIEDIPMLTAQFLKRFGANNSISKDVMQSLMDYKWPGNVRELENVIEHLVVMSDGNFKVADIPFVNGNTGKLTKSQSAENLFGQVLRGLNESHEELPETNEKARFLLKECSNIDVEAFILNSIYNERVSGKTVGRRTLVALAKAEGLILAENEVRVIIEKLRKTGLITVHRGRAGCKLTVKGYEYLNNI